MKPMEYASVASPGENSIVSGRTKMGHKFCGGCCDMRRAVIICDIILLVALTFKLVFDRNVYSIGVALIGSAEELSDDSFKSADDDFSKTLATSVTALKKAEDLLLTMMILTIIGLATTSASIWGASKFNYYPVALNAVFLSLHALLPFFMGIPNYGGLIINSFWIYPHVVFSLEARSGILSRETYGREESSCCCVSNNSNITEEPGVQVAEAEMI